MIRFAVSSWTRRVATWCLALLLAATPAVAQAPPVEGVKNDRVAEQTDIFRKCLQLLKFKPIESFDDLEPKDSILIVLGDTSRLTEVKGGLKSFLEKGGAVFIASDKPMPAGAKLALLDSAGVFISGAAWSNSQNANRCYRKILFCPFVALTDPRFMNHPKTGELLEVATNLPSALIEKELTPGVKKIAYLPLGTSLEGLSDQWVLPFGVAGDVGAGRILVLADHSIFINEMMKPADNNNVEFTANCLAYLRGENGQRRRVLFVDDGTIVKSFDAGPPLPSTAMQANAILNGLQERLNQIDETDGFNRKFWDVLTHNDPERIRKIVILLLVIATLLLLMYGCYRFGIASRFYPESKVPALSEVVGEQAPDGTLLEMRHEALLEANAFWEVGRQLARTAFEASGVPAPNPYHEPRVRVRGVWWRRGRRRREVRLLWQLAFRDKPQRLAPAAVQQLPQQLDELQAALKRGTIQVK